MFFAAPVSGLRRECVATPLFGPTLASCSSALHEKEGQRLVASHCPKRTLNKWHVTSLSFNEGERILVPGELGCMVLDGPGPKAALVYCSKNGTNQVFADKTDLNRVEYGETRVSNNYIGSPMQVWNCMCSQKPGWQPQLSPKTGFSFPQHKQIVYVEALKGQLANSLSEAPHSFCAADLTLDGKG